MKFKIIKWSTILFIVIIGSYFLINYTISGDNRFTKLKSLVNYEQRQLIKKYIFPYKLISQQEQIISEKDQKIELLKLYWSDLELDYKKSGNEIEIKQSSVKLSNNKTLKKYKLTSGFYSGINSRFPGSGYIDFYT